MLRALLQFGESQGVAWGAYGECSPHVLTIAQAVAAKLAQQRWREIGSRNYAEALGYFTAAIKRRWGCEAVFAQARMRLDRLPYVGRRVADMAAAAADELGDWAGATAFEADEAGWGVAREGRAAPDPAWRTR